MGRDLLIHRWFQNELSSIKREGLKLLFLLGQYATEKIEGV